MSAKILLLATASLALAAFESASAQAQTPVASGGLLDEVVVTASRRTESVQNAAAAISAIGSERLVQSGVTEARQLAQVAPSLVVAVGQSESVSSQFRLRGIGTAGQQVGFEGSVGVYLDNAYIARGGIATTDLLDVKRG
jgi:iron complex outermembrane recepter protein